MAEIALAQTEADRLIKIEKHRVDNQIWSYPPLGGATNIPVVSMDGREDFLIDITRGQISLRVSHQNRYGKTTVLVRLDLSGPPHRNPDGQEVPTPHLHLYKEGYHDKWAYAVPPELLVDPVNLLQTAINFMGYCNITKLPTITGRLL